MPRRWFCSSVVAATVALVSLVGSGCSSSLHNQIRFSPRAGVSLQQSIRTESTLLMRQNIPFVHVHINGHGPYLFAVDTGANVTVVSDHVVEDLRDAGAGDALRYRATARGAAGGEVRLSGVYHVRAIDVGSHRFEDFHAAIIDLSHVRGALGEDVAGVLGFSLFEDQLVTIDYPGSRLVIESGALPHADDVEILPMTLQDGLPVLPVNFGGRDVQLVMDTGSDQAFALPQRVADDMPFSAAPTPGPMAATIGGVSRRLVGQLGTDAEMGIWRVVRPEIMITDGRARVGGDVLSNFVVTFDQRNGSVRLAESMAAPIPLAATAEVVE